MGLSDNQRNQIKELLSTKITNKLKKYARETSSMPFLVKLMQDKEKVASYSFILSLATTLGMSVYEDVSRIIAAENSDECFTQYGTGGVISKKQKSIIDNILRELRNNEREADIEKEIEEVLAGEVSGGKFQKEGNVADLYFLRNGVEHYFEIKTAKPNIDIFTKSKSKLLEWVARKRKYIKGFLVFPYNPYYPKPYDRFTMVGLMKPGEDLLIGEQYWNYIGGENTYSELLALFDEVGKEFKDNIDEKIKEVAQSKMDI